MNYLICNADCQINMLDCVLEQENAKLFLNKIFLKANLPYQIEEIDNQFLFCLATNKKPIYINFYETLFDFVTQKNVVLVKHKGNNYLFLNFQNESEYDFRTFKFLNKQVVICLHEYLTICVDDKQVLHKIVDNLKFSHYEIDGQICYIYFKGENDFLICLKNDELIWADSFQEFNAEKGERQFLKYVCDGLNHGKVLDTKNNEAETYLVYLDDFEMNLKPEFLALIFMDCLLAGNYTYCLNLVDKSVGFNKQNLQQFFPDFDYYFPLNATTAAMFKKNALVGICEFEIVDDKIVNIILD